MEAVIEGILSLILILFIQRITLNRKIYAQFIVTVKNLALRTEREYKLLQDGRITNLLNFDIFPDKTLPPEILMNEVRRKCIPCENEQVFCLSNKNIKVFSIIEGDRGRNYYVIIKSELFNRSIKDVILSVNCITEMLSLINLEHQGLTII